MTFREYLRWDGATLIVIGASLYAFGIVDGHEGAADALFSGLIMTLGTALFTVVRHRVPFRDPSAWFTTAPLAKAGGDFPPARRHRLLLGLLAETMFLAATAVGLSFATGFWLTYMDMGVWAIAIGAIKIGPATVAIAEHEARTGTSYHVDRHPLRGIVRLTVTSGRGPRSHTAPI